MKRTKMSKVLFSIISIFAIANVFAIPKGPCDTKTDVCCQDAQDTYAFSYPKDMGLACPRDFYATGDFLWMKPSMDGLEYALSNDSSNPDGFDVSLNNGIFKGFTSGSQEWDWRPGFRANVGFYSDFDAWNFDLAWTYMRIKADSSVNYAGAGALLPMFLQPSVAVTTMPNASARWSGDFNTFDISMGKPYHVSRYYVANPMFGIRAAWIDQDYLVRYSLNSADPSVNVFHKNNYWGVGLKGSYKGEFLLGANWNVYGKAAFSLLFSKFDTSQHSTYSVSYKLQEEFYTVQPNAEIAFGFSWGKFFNKNQYFASLKVGYEFHQWWDINQLRRFFDSTNPVAVDTVSRGDLSFNGFHFGLGLDF